MNDAQRKELIAEFELLQGKIDKMGDFAFRVKAWSISLTTAIVVGSVSSQIPPVATLVGLLGIVGFAIVEKQQLIWKSAFQARCRVIDDKIRKDSIRSDPNSAKDWAKAISSGPPQSLVHAIDLASRRLQKNWLGWVYLNATNIFYWGQVLLVLFITICMSKMGSTKKVDQRVEVYGSVSVNTTSIESAASTHRGSDNNVEEPSQHQKSMVDPKAETQEVMPNE